METERGLVEGGLDEWRRRERGLVERGLDEWRRRERERGLVERALDEGRRRERELRDPPSDPSTGSHTPNCISV